ncbi:MAG: Na/Pi cotransporter family protein [Ignavibacteriaceae bacterium]|nr:Na/Pi cotransporter family protein [Ignavibacteriaceae bacterium]
MTTFNTIIAIVAAISLFLFSLGGFSKELQTLGSEKLKVWLAKVTANRFGAFLLGASLTAIIQSSSAVTSITVALVDAGVIQFFNSLGVLVGSNLGTTFTAWLVAFKLDNLGSWLIVAGTIAGFLPAKIHLFGKSIFYLGLILFSLQLINNALKPVSAEPEIIELLANADFIPYGILAGIIVTAVVQSSSVTTGLTIILASQGLLNIEGAIAIVLGSNLGTTSTALLASASLSKSAKNSAVANFIFNFLGLVMFLPFIGVFTKLISSLNLDISFQVATGHLLFNLIVSVVTLPLLRPLSNFVLKITKTKT